MALLRESNKGNLQGLTPDEYRKKDCYKEYKSLSIKDRFFSPMGKGDRAESKEDLAIRLIQWLNKIRNDPSLRGKTIVVVMHGNPLKVVDTLARNEKSLKAPENLRNVLKQIPEYTDPESCAVYWYTTNPHSFERIGRLLFQEAGKAVVGPHLPLRES